MKTFIVAISLFLSSFCFAQDFKTSVIISPGISWYNPTNTSEISKYITFNPPLHNYAYEFVKFSYALSAREEFIFSKIFSFGIELEFINTKEEGSTPNNNYTHIPEYSEFNLYTISDYNINIPVFIKLRTNNDINKGFNFYIGVGMNFIMYSDRNVELLQGWMGSSNYSTTQLIKDLVYTKTNNGNRIGTIGLIGIGKNIRIKKISFLTEIRYGFDINKWLYPTYDDPLYNYFDIKRGYSLLNLGLTF